MPAGAQCDMPNPIVWAWNSGRPWWPDWVMSAMRFPATSSRKVSKALRFVFGPSRCVLEASTIAASLRWASMPSPPTSAKPAAKITANFACAAATSSNIDVASPTRITARSTGPGTSAIVFAQGTPSSSS